VWGTGIWVLALGRVGRVWLPGVAVYVWAGCSTGKGWGGVESQKGRGRWEGAGKLPNPGSGWECSRAHLGPRNPCPGVRWVGCGHPITHLHPKLQW